MSEHPGIPVEEAKRIAEKFGKTHVVITAYDRREQMTYTATYGVEAQDKVEAARMGEIFAGAAGCDLSKSTMYEDFRKDFQPALFRESVELMRKVVNAHDKELIGALDHIERFLVRNAAALNK